MIPLSVDVPMKRIPWANWGLILVTVVVSLAVPAVKIDSLAILQHQVTEPTFSPLVLQRQHFAMYQLMTALFQHADLIHLAGNMLFLFIFGNAINAKLGHLGYIAAYLGIGVLESLIWLVLPIGQAALGASAAIMGICGMFLVLYPRNSVQFFTDDLPILLLSRDWFVDLPGWVVVLLFMAFDLWGAIFHLNQGVGYISHLVGALLGIVLAVSLLMSQWLAPDRGEQTLLQWLSGEGPVERDPPRKSVKRSKK
jgi:membrane associated rhomboid family serine protease